jgi:hypothetical protein
VITNSLTFLELSLAWQYWLQGAFVIVGDPDAGGQKSGGEPEGS